MSSTAVFKWLWDQRDWIAQRYRELRDWWSTPQLDRGILILGPGGVGKSTLGRLLAGIADPPL
jgi:ABC-type nitrate/sulfonate/bicarbonate transport system ATPase subunit